MLNATITAFLTSSICFSFLVFRAYLDRPTHESQKKYARPRADYEHTFGQWAKSWRGKETIYTAIMVITLFGWFLDGCPNPMGW